MIVHRVISLPENSEIAVKARIVLLRILSVVYGSLYTICSEDVKNFTVFLEFAFLNEITKKIVKYSCFYKHTGL